MVLRATGMLAAAAGATSCAPGVGWARIPPASWGAFVWRPSRWLPAAATMTRRRSSPCRTSAVTHGAEAALEQDALIAQGDAICGEANAALCPRRRHRGSDPEFQATQELQITRSELRIPAIPDPARAEPLRSSTASSSALEDQVDALGGKQAAVDQGDDPPPPTPRRAAPRRAPRRPPRTTASRIARTPAKPRPHPTTTVPDCDHPNARPRPDHHRPDHAGPAPRRPAAPAVGGGAPEAARAAGPEAAPGAVAPGVEAPGVASRPCDHDSPGEGTEPAERGLRRLLGPVPVEARVRAARRDQLLVRAGLDDPARAPAPRSAPPA